MSIKLMSAIFETEMRELSYEKNGETRNTKPSTAKLVLLAIADHANDYGESAYPGFDKLQIKTGLSRGGLADTIMALDQNGLLTIDKRGSRVGTNNYTINIKSFPPMYKESEDLPELVYPVDSGESTQQTQESLPSRPEPSVKPLVKPSKQGDLVDGIIELSKMPGVKKQLRLEGIQSRIAVAFNINCSWNRWEKFIRFADKQEQAENQTIEGFADWLKSKSGFDVSYWPPDKMQEVWPQAFIENQESEDYYPTL